MTINLHIYPSSFKYESRILREINAVSESHLFSEIQVFATWEPNLAEIEDIGNGQTVRRIKTFMPSSNKLFKLIKYLEWQARTIAIAMQQPISCVSIHSLSSLLLAIPFRIFKKTKLVYATHELETETIGLSGIIKIVAKVIERLIIKSNLIDLIITVNQSIADWYVAEYELQANRVVSIRNIPDSILTSSTTIGNIEREKTRSYLKLSSTSILFIYQGCISEGRGIEILINTFQKLEATNSLSKHILFIGYGELVERVRRASEKSTIIHYHDAVPPNQLAAFTQSADVGISLIENACLSYYYSLPNKVFEYLSNQLPAIVSDFPEMKSLVQSSDSGWAVAVNEDSLLELLISIDKHSIEQKKRGAIDLLLKCNWNKEKNKLISAYKTVIAESKY